MYADFCKIIYYLLDRDLSVSWHTCLERKLCEREKKVKFVKDKLNK